MASPYHHIRPLAAIQEIFPLLLPEISIVYLCLKRYKLSREPEPPNTIPLTRLKKIPLLSWVKDPPCPF